MKKQLVNKLKEELMLRCPVDTGALFGSISPVQGNEKEWVITIGNDDASISGTPTVEYAAATNFALTLKVFAKGKRKDPKIPQFVIIPNPNYHWVNDAVDEWVQKNKLLLDIQQEDEESEVNIE